MRYFGFDCLTYDDMFSWLCLDFFFCAGEHQSGSAFFFVRSFHGVAWHSFFLFYGLFYDTDDILGSEG